MVIELRVRIQPYLGLGQEGHMREATLKRMAREAGFMRHGVPSVSRWLQHLADQKIAEIGGGYYAVQIEKDNEQSVVFLDRRPARRRYARVEFVEDDGAYEVRVCGKYLRLVDEDGARDMLREYEMGIADSEPVRRETWLAVEAVEAASEDTDNVPVVSGWNGKVVRTRFRELLDETGLAENTLVVFTADHGDYLGDHGMYGKGLAYDGALHVPLISRGPGIRASVCVDTVASLLEVAPTVLDWHT